MSAQITEQKILDALKSVQMPGQNSDILTAEGGQQYCCKRRECWIYD